MLDRSGRNRLFWTTVISVIILDQLTKEWAVRALQPPHIPREIWGNFLRFTPDGLKSLFSDLECLTAEFDATERRREPARRGRSECADIFTGSREGWRVHFCGRKGLMR